jgi:hypothetical protein
LIVCLRAANRTADELCLGRAVGAVGGSPKAIAIDDGGNAAMALDQTLSLKKIEGHRDAGAAHAEHDGKKFVRDAQLVDLEPVMSHQEPTRQSIFEPAPDRCVRQPRSYEARCSS